MRSYTVTCSIAFVILAAAAFLAHSSGASGDDRPGGPARDGGARGEAPSTAGPDGRPSRELPAGPTAATFDVYHSVTLTDLPPGEHAVRIWFWLPCEDQDQRVLDIGLTEAPRGTQVTRDATGQQYLYASVPACSGPTPSLATHFVIRRSAVSVAAVPTRCGVIDESHRRFFAEHLDTQCQHMQVTKKITDLADKICGGETNVALQAARLANWVVDNTNHYSLPGAPPSSGQGDASYCLQRGGGGCTDQHALFIALARARGIPTRLQFGSLLDPRREGEERDPGYRCWVLYFAPNYGWIPMDLSAADTHPSERSRYLGGLDAFRIRFGEGRDRDLCPKQDGPRPTLVLGAYAEVDGKPYPRIRRSLRFRQI